METVSAAATGENGRALVGQAFVPVPFAYAIIEMNLAQSGKLKLELYTPVTRVESAIPTGV